MLSYKFDYCTTLIHPRLKEHSEEGAERWREPEGDKEGVKYYLLDITASMVPCARLSQSTVQRGYRRMS